MARQAALDPIAFLGAPPVAYPMPDENSPSDNATGVNAFKLGSRKKP